MGVRYRVEFMGLRLFFKTPVLKSNNFNSNNIISYFTRVRLLTLQLIELPRKPLFIF